MKGGLRNNQITLNLTGLPHESEETTTASSLSNMSKLVGSLF